MTNPRMILLTMFSSLTAGALLIGCATDESQPTAPREQRAEERRAEHMAHGQQLFAELDADRSGALSAAELEGVRGPATMIKRHFAEIDANRDGQLTHDELRVAMERHHADMDSHHTAVVEQFDTDGDGEMSPDERQAAHRHHFDLADTDDSGTLSRAELQAVPGPGAMLLEHLAEIDKDGDGALSYDEVTTAMEAHHRHHDR
jgi:Ca2+-binding EF-hand superfamily protein